MTEDEARQLASHRHYKGGLYKVLGEAKHSETGESLVIYEHLWPHDRSLWARPSSMYYDRLADGRLRFEPISVIVFDKAT